jgi:N-acyl-L-homoserine lactone synthetase
MALPASKLPNAVFDAFRRNTMLLMIERPDLETMRPVLGAMFEARKKVFVDLLAWDVPVVNDRYEIDQFDDQHARYLIVLDGAGRHRASARLLPTARAGILSTLFPQLCEQAPPSASDIFEITRFCLSPEQPARDRREARDALVTGLARYALGAGIRAYVGVAEIPWLQQILAFGWDCMPLGLPSRINGRLLGALRIDIDSETLRKLDRAGIVQAPLPLSSMAA